MAILTNEEKEELRKRCASDFVVDYVKADINAAVQAVEDWIDSAQTRADIGTAIENAAPGKFTNAKKRKITRWTLRRKFSTGE